MQFQKIEHGLIDRDPDQPRKEFETSEDASLEVSLRTHGQLVPLLVYRKGDRFILMDGERRHRAAAKLGLKEMLACVLEGPSKPADRLLAQLVISCQRKDFNPLEKANSFAALKAARSLNNKQLAELLNVSPSTVSQVLSVLEQDAQIQERVASGELSMTGAYALRQEKDPAKRRELASQEGISRTAIQAATRTKPASTVTCRLVDGKVTVSSERSLDAASLIELLTQTASAVRKAAKQGLDLPTIERVLADRAKLPLTGAAK